jgi:hypothetical protein
MYVVGMKSEQQGCQAPEPASSDEAIEIIIVLQIPMLR